MKLSFGIHRTTIAVVGMATIAVRLCAAQPVLEWRQLPPLPDPIGFAGAFAGTSGGALIVAGGANFPDKPPWEGGRKVWYDTTFVLEHTNGPWRKAAPLPGPLGYGVSVTAPEGVLCAGGSDATRHSREVFLLRYVRGELVTQTLPPLPGPLANSCGALLGHTVYLAGGTATPDATNALRQFWALDLQPPLRAWRELPSWSGPARMLSVAATVGGSFYLIGGASLRPDGSSKPVRIYLKDVYRFTPGQGWTRVADSPNPVVAAPSPAPVFQERSLLVIGGDDGSLANFEPKSAHPGFPKRVMSYDTQSDQWRILAPAPMSRATLPAVCWEGIFVMPSGETRPGIRSPEVWALTPAQPP